MQRARRPSQGRRRRSDEGRMRFVGAGGRSVCALRGRDAPGAGSLGGARGLDRRRRRCGPHPRARSVEEVGREPVSTVDLGTTLAELLRPAMTDPSCHGEDLLSPRSGVEPRRLPILFSAVVDGQLARDSRRPAREAAPLQVPDDGEWRRVEAPRRRVLRRCGPGPRVRLSRGRAGHVRREWGRAAWKLRRSARNVAPT